MADTLALCQLCNGLEKKDESDTRLAFDMEPAQLMSSARFSGCACCAVMLAAVEQFGVAAWSLPPSWDPADRVVRIYAYGLSSDRDTLSLELYLKDEGPKRTLELFFPESGTNPGSLELRAVRPRPSLSGHPMSPAGLQWVRMQLQTCLERHVGCRGNGEGVLPKRVLEFQEVSPGIISVRLRTESNDRTMKKFAALSHCWGSHQACTTTKATLEDHKRGIPWSKIPQTFQDGIRFCLALGIHHLWIDALCIVQDDPVDWQIESARMADIYQNADITLAATHSSSDSGGCFPEHHDLVTERALSLPHGIASPWRGIQFRDKARHWTMPLPKSSSRSYPLLTRGWAFQERILAPRVVYFCRDEMSWECNSLSTCECGGLPIYDRARDLFSDITEVETVVPAYGLTRYSVVDLPDRRADPAVAARILIDGLSTEPVGHNRTRRNALADLLWRFEDPILPLGALPGYGRQGYDHRWNRRFQSDQPTASRRWQQMVEQYSPLLLSKDTDRLPALSGIASNAQPHLGSYLAGLWSSSLASDLLWRVSQLDVGLGSPATPQGPSWSWACSRGAVRYWDDLRVDITRPEVGGWNKRKPVFKSASVKPAGRNPFGEVAPGGNVIIEGYLLSAKVQYVRTRPWLTGSSRAEELDPLKYEVHFALDLPLLADHVLSEEGPHHVPDGTEVSMLLVHPDVCLVLMPSQGVVTPPAWATYRRIGIVRQPAAYAQVYTGAVDWMVGSVKECIGII
ncbi:heterokaryon incompatibility protein-domain-containing protein [Staphylotrichum tortipilum]|uniref:Heterokaryon incompatibility protein-domain-containing protein n=1 Tax=Staphylotrichum tortipilum TaxID=2831512 RepID=A0AAN6MMS6_9PEZI|nr:heterokaryon incompatibility protein-domain-containing protein [Staphylotrichum longicolle]